MLSGSLRRDFWSVRDAAKREVLPQHGLLGVQADFRPISPGVLQASGWMF